MLRLRLPIYVVDQVRYEATRHAEQFPDARRIEAFIRANPAVVHEFVTGVGRAAAARRNAGDGNRQRGIGEAVIAEFLARLDEVTDAPDDPVVLLYDDSDIRRSRFVLPGNVHVASTRALLLGMERRGLVESAEAVWESMIGAGRSPSAAETEMPASVGREGSFW